MYTIFEKVIIIQIPSLKRAISVAAILAPSQPVIHGQKPNGFNLYDRSAYMHGGLTL